MATIEFKLGLRLSPSHFKLVKLPKAFASDRCKMFHGRHIRLPQGLPVAETDASTIQIVEDLSIFAGRSCWFSIAADQSARSAWVRESVSKIELILDFLIHLNSTLDHCQTRNLSPYIIYWFGKVHLDGRRGTLSLPLVKLHVAVQSMTAAGSLLWDSCHILSFSAERIQLESASSRTAPKKVSFRVQG